MTQTPNDINRRARQIRMLACDVDGVLTDGGVYGDGQRSWCRFNIKDGYGLRMLGEANITCAVISGRGGEVLEQRCRELGITECHGHIIDKLTCCRQIAQRLELTMDQIAYIGDDLPDLPLLQQVGLSAAPADAVDRVRAACLWQSKHLGGHGAVRELADLILAAQAAEPATDGKDRQP